MLLERVQSHRSLTNLERK